MQLKVKAIHDISRANMIKYATSGSAGIDLIAAIDEPMSVRKGEIVIVPSGLCIQMDVGFEAQIRTRSGMASKGVVVLNSPGTIDSDYRGEIRVIMMNVCASDFVIEPGMRIAQMVIARYEKADIVYVDELDDTARSDGGFGSTGMY